MNAPPPSSYNGQGESLLRLTLSTWRLLVLLFASLCIFGWSCWSTRQTTKQNNIVLATFHSAIMVKDVKACRFVERWDCLFEHLCRPLIAKLKRQGHDVCNDCQTKKKVVVVAEPSRKFLSMKVESTCAFPVSQSMRPGGLATSLRHLMKKRLCWKLQVESWKLLFLVES